MCLALMLWISCVWSSIFCLLSAMSCVHRTLLTIHRTLLTIHIILLTIHRILLTIHIILMTYTEYIFSINTHLLLAFFSVLFVYLLPFHFLCICQSFSFSLTLHLLIRYLCLICQWPDKDNE
jgi:hypothetical protein